MRDGQGRAGHDWRENEVTDRLLRRYTAVSSSESDVGQIGARQNVGDRANIIVGRVAFARILVGQDDVEVAAEAG